MATEQITINIISALIGAAAPLVVYTTYQALKHVDFEIWLQQAMAWPRQLRGRWGRR